MMNPQVQVFFHEPTYTFSYVVREPDGNAAAIIDSVLDYDLKSGRTHTDFADTITSYVKEKNLDVKWILETHAHADHLTAAPYLQEKLDGKIAIGEHIKTVQRTFKDVFNAEPSFALDGSQFDHLFEDGEEFAIGRLNAGAMHTPGHTPACLTYVIGDAAFVGDTVFAPDYGTARADFPKGDARTLYRSIQKIFQFPVETRLFLCHDYLPGGRPAIHETSVADQRANNIQIHDGVSEDEYVKLREERDKTLEMPLLILPSIQINMRAGHLPLPENNGTSYLKIPVNRL